MVGLLWGFVVRGFCLFGGCWFFFLSETVSNQNVSPSILPFPFPSLESLDLPTGEAEIWSEPLQPVPNPISKLPHYAFPREKVGFGS